MISLTVTARVKAVLADLPRRCRDRGDAAQMRPSRLAAQPPGVIPGRDEQQRHGARAGPVDGEQPRGTGGHQRDDELVQPLELAVQELARRPSSRSAMRRRGRPRRRDGDAAPPER